MGKKKLLKKRLVRLENEVVIYDIVFGTMDNRKKDSKKFPIY
jgi:hypothetical protein